MNFKHYFSNDHIYERTKIKNKLFKKQNFFQTKIIIYTRLCTVYTDKTFNLLNTNSEEKKSIHGLQHLNKMSK